MQIDSIETWVLDLPSRLAATEIAAPMDKFVEHRHRRGSWYGSMEPVVVKITAGKRTGLGLTQGGRAVAALIDHHLGPLLHNKDATKISELWELCRRASYPYGTSGLASMARSALDLALWDLAGHREGAPIWELLGGSQRTVEVYASGNDLEYLKSLGFTMIKIGLTAGPWDAEAGYAAVVDQVEAARRELGPERQLMVDAWMGWDPEFAAAIAPVLVQHNVSWLEEPLPPDCFAGLRSVADALGPVQLATGEHLYAVADFARLIELGVSILQPDLSWCGGLTAGLAIGELADSAGVEVAPHLGGLPWGLHLVSASSVCRRAEWYVGSQPGEPLSAEPTVFEGQTYPESGLLTPSTEPGFGVGLNEDLLQRYAIIK